MSSQSRDSFKISDNHKHSVFCLVFALCYWLLLPIFFVSIVKFAKFVAISFSDAKIIRYATSMEEYELGFTRALDYRLLLQERILNEEVLSSHLLWGIIPFLVLSIIAILLNIFRRSAYTNYDFSNLLCVTSVENITTMKISSSVGLGLFGVLVTVFSLWSGAI